VTYPVVDDEVVAFCSDKRAVLLLEEGQPDYIEQNINAILRRRQNPRKRVGSETVFSVA